MTTVKPLTEKEWQQLVLELAAIYGWHVNHTRTAIVRGGHHATPTSTPGWPDLTLWHETQHRAIFAELKTDRGRLTADQIAVLRSLNAAGVETYVWRPADLDDIVTCLAP